MKIIVQKYGGTSVNKPALRKKIIENALKAKEEGFSPVLVVSAMGRKGEAYATDSLLALLPDSAEADRRTKDFLITCGENITCAVLAEEMRAQGIRAYALNGIQAGIQTNGVYGNSDIIDIDTAQLRSLIEEGIIPVVAGFQGRGNGDDIVTLGRGGSDITATALGCYLKADSVELYTDVAGIMTADPRVVEACRMIEALDYETVYTLAEQGAKVIHPRAVSFAQKGGIKVKVLSTVLGYGSAGTIISTAADDKVRGIAAVVSKAAGEKESAVSVIGMNPAAMVKLPEKMRRILSDEGIAVKDITIQNRVATAVVDAADEQRAVGYLHIKLI